ncbi:MAG: aspartate--tRNA ligase [Candidatus Eremiobacteraeota bacterium]|nr:aspartate--tRNA ligase [Candidatus Eremiobacteraeota bacterium]
MTSVDNTGTQRFVTCGELGAQDAGQRVAVRGWVNATRDHGGLIFIDVRDRYGVTQAVFDPRTSAREAYESAAHLRSEDVIMAAGTVRPRPAGTENANLSTGAIEVAADALTVLNKSKTPPFPLHGDADVDEALRMKYRYIDLRRAPMQRNIELRHRALKAARDYLDAQGFLEIETPMLIKSTPEGARDFLVPSRLHAGEFYALPQSPQLFKQLLMVAGFHRYFQMARCFRDEDSRADRQPEFSQIDIEMTFPTQDDVIAVIEGTLAHMFERALGTHVKTPFVRLRYDEALADYGSDKPDLRFAMKLSDFSPAFAGTEFKIFANELAKGHAIVGLVDASGAGRSRREFDTLVQTAAAEWGAKGLAWIAFASDGVKSSLPKAALTEAALTQVRAIGGAGEGDAVFFAADERAAAQAIAGKLRLHLGSERGLRDPARFEFCWVLDFPLFERDPESGALGPMHHPFTAPAPGQDLLTGDPLALRAQHYDVVLNGSELGSGSIRIHDPNVQRKVFELLGYSDEQVQQRFGFLLEAFAYGAPPHGGMALGIDRIIAIMVGAESIREVIAFPKNQRFQDLMIDAPSAVEPQSLRELRLRVDQPAQPSQPNQSRSQS